MLSEKKKDIMNKWKKLNVGYNGREYYVVIYGNKIRRKNRNKCKVEGDDKVFGN
jgi:CDP-diacylglycerol pyrophosphatase